MTSSDTMNKALRDANGRGTFTVETPSSPGTDWLRGEADRAALRGTDPGEENPVPPVNPPATPASTGSADGGAGYGQHARAGGSMNDWLRSSADASHAAHARDRGR